MNKKSLYSIPLAFLLLAGCQSEEVDMSTVPMMTTEAQAIEAYTDRGFEDPEILAKYDSTGEKEDKTIDNKVSGDDSLTMHPQYVTTYTDKDGDDWLVYLTGGQMTASPKDEAAKLVSEVEDPVNYMPSDNKYEPLDQKTLDDFLQVEEITPETLDEAFTDAVEDSAEEAAEDVENDVKDSEDKGSKKTEDKKTNEDKNK